MTPGLEGRGGLTGDLALLEDVGRTGGVTISHRYF
jgi:hypothetical protein